MSLYGSSKNNWLPLRACVELLNSYFAFRRSTPYGSPFLLLESSSLSFISPSAHEIKSNTKEEHNHAVDGHHLVRCISYVVRVRTHSDQMPCKEGDSDNADNYASDLHKFFFILTNN